MVRGIFGVFAGVLVMGAVVMGGVFALMAAVGLERLLEPSTYELSKLMIVAGIALRVAGSVLGGLVCRVVSRGPNAVRVLAGIALLLGLANAGAVMRKPVPGPRPANVTWEQVAENGREPVWYALTTAAIGCVGVLVGGGMGQRRV